MPRYSSCYPVFGHIVGLKEDSEQYIIGDGYISGSYYMSGYYHGAHYNIPAKGAMGGGGRVYGEQRTRTVYEYRTKFFIRSGDYDCPVVIHGNHFPIMDGQRACAVIVTNNYKESKIFCIINFSTNMVLFLLGKKSLIRFLDIPEFASVNRSIMSADARDRRLELHTHLMDRHLPWLLVMCSGGLFALLIGLIMRLASSRFGAAFTLVGLSVAVPISSAILYLYYRKWALKKQPLSEVVSIKNPDIDREINFILNYVDTIASYR